MDARSVAVERGLVASAVATLTARALGGLPLESLGPTKALLKRYFSDGPWDAADDEALATAVGPGEGRWREPLGDDLALDFGWSDGRFGLRVDGAGGPDPSGAAGPGDALAASFEGDIVPEATPNPRTLVFRTGQVLEGPSREYRSASEAAQDPRAARLLEAFPDLATVLVASDFVALTVRRPGRWPALLAPVLAAVTEEFGGGTPPAAGTPGVPGMAAVHAAGAPASGRAPRPETRLDRAWRELGGLRPADPADLRRLVAASAAPEPASRQVAAGLLKGAPPEAAAAAWGRLVGDASRGVRRAAVDAVVDSGRGDLRPLLERALADEDAWVRWKALRGLAELGAAPSRDAVAALSEDRDFRVRLEARAALRR